VALPLIVYVKKKHKKEDRCTFFPKWCKFSGTRYGLDVGKKRRFRYQPCHGRAVQSPRTCKRSLCSALPVSWRATSTAPESGNRSTEEGSSQEVWCMTAKKQLKSRRLQRRLHFWTCLRGNTNESTYCSGSSKLFQFLPTVPRLILSFLKAPAVCKYCNVDVSSYR
jgi:hypothetical protein